jgi:small conductance mechanosensitive channel
MKRLLFIISFIALLGFAPNGVAAQAPQGAGVPAVAEISALIETLEDDTARAKLIRQLKILKQAKGGDSDDAASDPTMGGTLIDLLSKRIDGISSQLVGATRSLADLPVLYSDAVTALSDDKARARWIALVWKLAVILLAGLLLEWLLRRVLGRPRAFLNQRDTGSLLARIPVLGGKLVLEILPVAGFLAGGYAVLTFVQAAEVTRVIAIALLNALMMVRVILAAARIVLAPASGAGRLVPLRDEDANYLFIWTRRLAQTALYGHAIIGAARTLGLPNGAAEAALTLVGFLVTVMIIVLVRQNRSAVANCIRGVGADTGKATLLRRRIADVWHIVVIVFVAVLFGVWAFSIEGGLQYLLKGAVLSALIIVIARFANGGAVRLARRIFALKPEVVARFPGLEARANRYLPMMERAIMVLISIIVVFGLLQTWGIDALAWLATPFGNRVAGSAISIGLLLVATVIIWEVASAMIEKYLSRGEGDVSARARTLLPLMRTTLLVVLVTMVVLLSLSELGINIGPLLAGAGVIGLAVGFGAQTLVKDIITGMFILIEDQIAVGDVIRVGAHAGVIEKLSLRTIRLRDLAGVVHTVPFSEVTTLENLTKDFSRYVFNVGVAYREDTDQVVDILHALGEEMRQDPDYKDLILEPLEVLGVDELADNAVIIKARFTTQPIKQWQVGREFNRRMKKRFDELGIEIPFPHRTIYFGEDKAGNAPSARITQVAERSSTKQDQWVTQRRETDAPVPESGGADAGDSD